MKINNHNSFFIPCGLFLGLGLGLIFKEIVAGAFLGLALGFLLYIIFNKRDNK
ncbi:hypothetical protein H6Y62_00600 [Staphylococcus lugdunensis]|jgi:type III secretory pathway component EscT|uniref:Glycine zipper family protein n=1 Tax=Staphylococcus lugdunensis TaxID=28035 RepID=A0ABD4EIV3_STALU|nr:MULTISPECIES: hypothetical protein [Staphylococcus]CCB52549.1 hypothetical secreted protein [Staphylococcus lugdunensis N920143]ADC86290.1 hypothetical protein SLGD_00142 [Staphylococcus lugdunensis HKU09-01]EFU83477.1 hypothetical protein HMPREF0790_1924 [Staphylococcus lugdunensis M23590]EHS05334.1 hypothetical protein SEVCU139_2003 [Staphylococcus lugdunensis VCU139]EVI52937.1 hypothetical protein T979_00550 [Staphylococcus lugdunensis UCIM6116]